jgi:hypothetical protein
MTQMFATQTVANTDPLLAYDNDLYIGPDGNLAIVYDLQAVLQACEHAAKAQLGEMFLATDQGIPNFQLIWVGVPNLIQWQAALRSAWLNIPDVVDIVSLIGDQVGDILTYTAIIRTSFGTGAISG